jgi:hypothetical protein
MVAVVSLGVLAVMPTPALAEVDQAVIGILGGMQCSL